MKPWQKGFELDLLKQMAAPFKDRYKPYAHGAFGLPKERDLAAAHEKGGVLFTRNNTDGPIKAAAIFSRLKVASSHSDFTGRTIKLPPGSFLIRHVAGFDGPPAELHLIRHIRGRSESSPVFVEINEEDHELRTALMAEGAKYVATKISAGSAIRGLYAMQPFGTADLPPEELPGLLCLDREWLSEGQLQVVIGELRRFEERIATVWQQHYSSYNKGKTWTSFALRGYDPTDLGFIIKPAEMSKKWKAENAERLKAKPEWTVAAEDFRQTIEIAKAIAPDLDRVRFMRLDARGGELTRHADITDREAGTQEGKVIRLHLPLISADDCVFSSWDARGELVRQHMTTRGLWYLDQRKPHAVKNSASSIRVHLVVDAYSTDLLRIQLRKRAKEDG